MKGDMTIELDKKSYNKFMNIVNQLDKADKGKAVRNALREGIQVIITQGKTNLAQRNKVKTGNLKKSFAKRVSSKKSSAYAGFKRSAPGKGVQGANHSYLVDKGTKKRWTTHGFYRGSAKGSMFWTDAVESQGPAAMNKLMDAIYRTLDEITKRN